MSNNPVTAPAAVRTPPASPPPVGETRRLYRDTARRMLGGVAAGIAVHLRVPVSAVRAVFVALLALNGLGALLYVAFWAVLPPDPSSGPRQRPGALNLLGLLALSAGVLLFLVQSGPLRVDAMLTALVALIALGAGIIWHQAEPQRRRSDTERPDQGAQASGLQTGPGGRWFLLRLAGGGSLVIVGIIGVLTFISLERGEGDVVATLTGLVFALLALSGLVLAFAPLLYRVFGQLQEERIARIREQERAEVAAMVHDEVLHTLALIQRRAGDPATVARLARSQERALRNWLYKPTGSPADRFAAALEQAAAEVEDTYGVSIETVVVGDAPNDDRVVALVAAAREALVNAARHAKVTTVSLYAEVEDDRITVYVRDRGAGFDLSAVDTDRHGIRGSITGRMRRHGGHAVIRTAPGEGTEVELIMPRKGGVPHE